MSADEVTLTPEQEAFVELVTNAMCTGALTVIEKLDQLRTRSARSGGTESARDVLVDILGDQPREFIKFRPFEVTDIMNALEKLK